MKAIVEPLTNKGLLKLRIEEEEYIYEEWDLE